jgi:hypothetical protein
VLQADVTNVCIVLAQDDFKVSAALRVELELTVQEGGIAAEGAL